VLKRVDAAAKSGAGTPRLGVDGLFYVLILAIGLSRESFPILFASNCLVLCISNWHICNNRCLCSFDISHPHPHPQATRSAPSQMRTKGRARAERARRRARRASTSRTFTPSTTHSSECIRRCTVLCCHVGRSLPTVLWRVVQYSIVVLESPCRLQFGGLACLSSRVSTSLHLPSFGDVLSFSAFGCVPVICSVPLCSYTRSAYIALPTQFKMWIPLTSPHLLTLTRITTAAARCARSVSLCLCWRRATTRSASRRTAPSPSRPPSCAS
jgi:hypothetical protein